MIGQRLAHYEILSHLGKGGMGEVYRARDTKLEREVAIKLLHDEVSRDPERVARFRREAKVLASLNHCGSYLFIRGRSAPSEPPKFPLDSHGP